VVWLCLLTTQLDRLQVIVVSFSPPWARRRATTTSPASLRLFAATSSSSFRLVTAHPFDRVHAQSFIEDLLPSQQYSDRIRLGRQAHDVSSGAALAADDPRLASTYAEFPLSSFDILLDAALERYKNYRDNQNTIQFVDIGSGLGRIALYMALSRGSSEYAWHINGIEVASLLHEKALSLVQEGIQRGVFAASPSTHALGCTLLSLHLGSAQHCPSILSNVDIVFAYSTAFAAKNFSPDVGAMILDAEWSEWLSKACRQGCIAITTDRALDQRNGWKLLERINVDNPEVSGSTGYIHVLALTSRGEE
jgi:hypothetical protein